MHVVLNEKQKEVARKIIYAVETGGQIYGNVGYDNFTEAYTNSKIEHAITIGGGAWYATRAQKLLKKIRSSAPLVFKRLDTASIGNDLDTKSWDTYRISKTSSKAKCIQKIIGSAEGKRCQDELIDEQMQQYINEILPLGVTDIDALIMCANFEHQGGISAVKRILSKTRKPYTLDNLYSACSTDTGNQVGAYKSRQRMVYNSLKKYIPQTLLNSKGGACMISPIEKIIKLADGEVGYLEKASNASLDSKTSNAGGNNYTKYWRDVAPQYQGSYWCACFVTWLFMKSFGLEMTKKLLYHFPYISCQTGYEKFKSVGRCYNSPQVGDIIVFWNGTRMHHTGLVVDVSESQGLFTTIEGNTSGGSVVVANGGGVAKKKYSISVATRSGHKFLRPDYSIIPNQNDDKKFSDTVKKWQSEMNDIFKNYILKYNGELLTVDGVFGKKSKNAALISWKCLMNEIYNSKLSLTNGKFSDKCVSESSKCIIKKGDKNKFVVILKGILASNKLFSANVINKNFGEDTENGVKAYQKNKKLYVDGIVGKNTWTTVFK